MPESTATQILNKRKRGPGDEPLGRPAPDAPHGVDGSAMDQLSAFNTNADGTQQNGGNNTAASDTAAAALDYPIISHANFQAQAAGGDYGDNGYGLDTLKESPTQGGQHSPGGGTPSKPTVGSEEWHKIRKDNHKEGMHYLYQFRPIT
jgi:transcriptional regulator CBF1